MRNVSDKNCTENKNTHVTLNNFVYKSNVVYETQCKNTVEPRPRMT